MRRARSFINGFRDGLLAQSIGEAANGAKLQVTEIRGANWPAADLNLLKIGATLECDDRQALDKGFGKIVPRKVARRETEN